MTYITVQEASEKWNIGTRRICILCKEGRVKGAIKKSRVWMIPQNAKKPDDGRKGGKSTGVVPAFLDYNPTYFDYNSIEPTPEEKKICEIQELFLQGLFSKAYNETCKALLNCEDIRYRCSYYFLKMIISADYDKKQDYIESEEKLREILSESEECSVERVLFAYYSGQIEYVDKSMLEESVYDELLPFIGLIFSKKVVNQLLKNIIETDVSGLEILCNEIDKKNCPAIAAYCHIIMAVYFNLTGVVKSFEMHYRKALDILLPRKWYTPLAEYSATINLDFIKSIDVEAYREISKLSESVISSYIQVGLFDDLIELPKYKSNMDIQIGYKLAQGKNIEEIALETGLSQYRVKQHIDDICYVSGLSSKKEIKKYILKNLFV